MTVTESGAPSTTSGVLDANPGLGAHTVEGFIGATSNVGITSVTINHIGSLPQFFEVDHIQVGPPACVPPPSAMVSWWDGDAVSGTTAFDIQDGNDGTLVNTASTATGLVGNAFSFDGVDDYVQIADDSSLEFGSNPYTIDLWFNMSNTTKDCVPGCHIFSKWANWADDDDWVLFIVDKPSAQGGPGQIRYQARNPALLTLVDDTKNYRDGQWHHVAVVKTDTGSTGTKLYVDGVLQASGAGVNIEDGTNSVRIGWSDLAISPEANTFPGLVDEVEVFNRALSAPTDNCTNDPDNEICQIFLADSAGKCKAEPGLSKVLTSGPDEDGVDGIDIAIQILQTRTTGYDYELTYVPAESDPDNVVIIDTVPAEWDVSKIDTVDVPDTNTVLASGLGLGCGETESGLGTGGKVDLARGGKVGKTCSSSTEIAWTLTPSEDTQTVRVDTTTRQSPSGKLKFKPTSCGKLTLNDGAQAFEANPDGTLVLDVDGNPIPVGDPSNSLMLVAVDDLNGGGLVGDGTGDEDGDTLEDADEAFNVGTDPCLADTDGDGARDDVDADPLNPAVQ